MRIGITQRVEEVASYKERRDCLDQQWCLLLEPLGLTVVPVPNSLKNVQKWLIDQKLQGFILSGGNDISSLPAASNPAPERDHTETAVLHYAKKQSLLVLGVCRGMQMMNVYLGGALVQVKNHIATRHAVKSNIKDSIFSRYIEVNSFHGWGLMQDQLGKDVVPLAFSENDATIESIQHTSLPWTGIMWHPEREKPFNELDTHLIKHFFKKRKL